MFIRRTQTRRTEDGQPYCSHRLVHSERIGNAVRQRTLLNLGRHFDIPQAQWPLVCSRIDDILAGQTPLVADWPARRRTRSATDSRTVGRPRHTGTGTGRRARHPAGRRRLAAPGPPPQRRRRAGRPVGPGASGPAGPAGRVGRQRRVALRGGRRHRRASGPARPRSVRRTAGCKRAAASASCSASTSRPSARCSSTAPRTRW